MVFTVQEIVSQNSKNLKSYGYAKSKNCFHLIIAEIVKNVNWKQLPRFSEIPQIETIFIYFQQNAIGHLYFLLSRLLRCTLRQHKLFFKIIRVWLVFCLAGLLNFCRNCEKRQLETITATFRNTPNRNYIYFFSTKLDRALIFFAQ